MKFALVCGKRTEATKGAKGFCPNCGSELIAKCGTKKTNHWAHKSTRNCDPWWENETEWHRSWKNHFPVEWQEFILRDDLTQEKHVADIRTDLGLVIEFQHSHIDPKERNARENFYKRMVWVVDGTRLKRDYQRFTKGKSSFRNTNRQGHFLVDFPDECFPASWLGSLVPVIFDFRGTVSIDNPNDARNYLYCLFPNNNKAIIAILSRQAFIDNTINGNCFGNHKEPREEQRQKPPQEVNIINRREPTHYYDPRKKRFVRRIRF